MNKVIKAISLLFDYSKNIAWIIGHYFLKNFTIQKDDSLMNNDIQVVWKS